LVLAASLVLQAQDFGNITGTVTDQTGAVVPNATVTLKDVATNRTVTAKTNAAGQFTYTRVTPGDYTITVTAQGFAATTLSGLKVSVGKAVLADVKLQVGGRTETVEVKAGTVNELQTLDASIGNVIGQRQLSSMANMNRDATSLVLLQPGTAPVPGNAVDESQGGQVAGARSDQNTFMVDGGDVTSNTDGNGAYMNNFNASPRGAIPTPVESLEEFRVITNNNVSGYQRSAGAEVQMVTRRGTNTLHGAFYDYMQQAKTNANTWERNFLNEPRPPMRDNRFGARIGGPIIKDKTFFFAHWESRHYLRGDSISRWAPTADARNGLLGYLATDGTYKTLNMASAALNCVDATNTAVRCDPRGYGVNSVVQTIWNSMPLPTSNTGGDNINFRDFTAPVMNKTNEEFGVFRFDQQIGNRNHLTASYRYGVTDRTTTNQVLIQAPAVTQALSNRPMQPRYLVFGLTSELTPNVTNDLHVDFLRHFWQWGTHGANPQVSTIGGALQLVNESVSSGVVPYNVDTQQARQRNWNGKDWNLVENISWLKGKHLFQIGGRYGWQRLNHLRNDKVTGGMAQPIYYSMWASSGYAQISGIPTPPDMDPDFLTAWNSAYVAMLGMVSQATQLGVRDGSLGGLPMGTWIQQHSAMNNSQLSFTDTWRIKPTITVTYGLTYGIQTPPYEASGKQTMEVDMATGKPFTVAEYLAKKKAAALAGTSWDPVIGFVPVRQLGRKYPFDIDYGNIGPHLAVAWNPKYTSEGFFSKLFGDGKTVVRAGWTRAFDRLNGVDVVMTPSLGIGFADLMACKGPNTAGVCAGSTNPTTAFRIGRDGNSITIPAIAAASSPVVPGYTAPYSVRDWHIDPARKVGSTDMFDLTIQRQMPANMLMEVGFIGRLSRNLYQKVDLNQVPYMFTKGGQTFAQAFDALQTALLAGTAPSAVTVQPFFEAALGGITSSYCSGYTSCTVAVATDQGGNIKLRDVMDTFANLDGSWTTGGFVGTYNNQVATLDTTVSWGRSTYAGAFLSLRKATSHGLSFDFNYTISKSMDQVGWNQDIIDTVVDAYDLNRTYGPSQWDRRHVLNAMVNLDLPFGKGKRFSAGNGLDRVLGGWSTSYIFTGASGLPMQVVNSNTWGCEYGDGCFYADPASMIATKSISFTQTRHSSPSITGVWGADSLDGYPNAFTDPAAVATAFRLPLFSDSRVGFSNSMRGQKRWNVDFALSKKTQITERFSTTFEMQMINAFNHPMLTDAEGQAGYMDLRYKSSFGVMDTQYNQPRYIQWGLRFDF
jgi:hypothetical protein